MFIGEGWSKPTRYKSEIGFRKHPEGTLGTETLQGLTAKIVPRSRETPAR